MVTNMTKKTAVSPQNTTPLKPSMTISILPFRYSVVSSENKDILKKFKAPENIESLIGIPLKSSRYVLKNLRVGYFYLLVEREGTRQWQAYRVYPDSSFKEIDPLDPAVNLKGRDHRLTPVILRANEVENVWYLFSPETMTPRKLDEYKQNAEQYVEDLKFQYFNPKKHISETGGNSQPHTMLPYKNFIYQTLSDYGNSDDREVKKALEGSMYPYDKEIGYHRHKQLEEIEKLLTNGADGAAVSLICFDPIGITQDLNHFRNSAMNTVDDFLDQKDSQGTSNRHKQQVHQALKQAKEAYIASKKTIVTQKALDDEAQTQEHFFSVTETVIRDYRSAGRHYEADREQRRLDERRAYFQNRTPGTLDEEYKKNWVKDVEKLLNMPYLRNFEQALLDQVKLARTKMDERIDDYLAWYESEQLLAAFDIYDDQSQLSGVNFALESSLCTVGVCTTEKGQAIIDKSIMATTVDRKNLYMRGFFNNQQEALQAANEIYANSAEPIPEDPAQASRWMANTTKSLVSAFKKIDFSFQTWVTIQNNNDYPYAQKWAKPGKLAKLMGLPVSIELLMFHKISEITTSVARKGMGGGFDRMMARIHKKFLYGRLSNLTDQVPYNVFMQDLEKFDAKKRSEGKRKYPFDEKVAERLSRRHQTQQNRVNNFSAKLSTVFNEVIEDAQRRMQVKQTLADIMSDTHDKTVNAYHHTRLGTALTCLEAVNLFLLINEGLENGFDTERIAYIFASALSLTSTAIDIVSLGLISIRDLPAYSSSTHVVNRAANFQRASLHVASGVMSGLAGGILGTMDVFALRAEWKKPDSDAILLSIYAIRGLLSFGSALVSFGLVKNFLALRGAGLAIERTLYTQLLNTRFKLLIWGARFSILGLVLTIFEVGYWILSDTKLEKWCKKSAFRIDKDATPYPDAKTEIVALFEALGFQYDPDVPDAPPPNLEEIILAL